MLFFTLSSALYKSEKEIYVALRVFIEQSLKTELNEMIWFNKILKIQNYFFLAGFSHPQYSLLYSIFKIINL